MKKSRFQFNWVLPVLFRPRKAFETISANGGTWLTPMLILTVTILLSVFASGWVQSKAALSGEIPTPPDFQYWTPDQQAQYMQSYQSQQSPFFLYGLPTMSGLTSAWLGWLVVGGMMHLVITLLGGRGGTSVTMTIVAWANLPFAVLKLVRAGYMFFAQHLITSAGLSGFIDTTSGGASLFWSALLALIDIYLIWHLVLLVFAVRSSTGISTSKALIGAGLVVIIALLSQALIGFGLSSLGSLSFTRPFFF